MEEESGLTNAIAIAGVMATLAGVVISFGIWAVQTMLADRKERFDSTMWLFARLQDPDAAHARFRVRSLLAKAQRRAGDDKKHRKAPLDGDSFAFDRLSDKERAQLASIGSLFGLAGLLFRRNRIDRTLFLDAWANSVQVNHERLLPYKKWRDKRLGSDNTLWREFEFLAAQAMVWRK